MDPTVEHFQMCWEIHSLLGTDQFVGLIDRHLRVLIPMKQEQGRVMAINEENRTGQLRQLRHRIRLTTEQ